MSLTTDADGRPILSGAGRLPPMVSRPPIEAKANSKRRNEPNRKTADRFKVLNAFIDSTMGRLSRSEIAVWMILYRDTRDGTVRTSQANIARRAGMSVRSVKVAIKKMTSAGLVRVVFQGGLNRGPSRYQVDPLGNRSS
ncbi:winged helix-turn-helix transcriptional regulator [Rosistilla oblonga]|uniref:winged helix-turn-helix transcriptional regulator n=1 Tax=Rosistilla oblonga TaxID=2527990 RepID=UPI003A970E6B